MWQTFISSNTARQMEIASSLLSEYITQILPPPRKRPKQTGSHRSARGKPNQLAVKLRSHPFCGQCSLLSQCSGTLESRPAGPWPLFRPSQLGIQSQCVLFHCKLPILPSFDFIGKRTYSIFEPKYQHLKITYSKKQFEKSFPSLQSKSTLYT